MILKAHSGQTLSVLLVFMAAAIIIISGAVVVTIVNSTSSGNFASGSVALDIAESGAENGLLRLIRNPNYSGEILPVGQGTATITVTDGATPTLISVGAIGAFSRKIQVKTSYNNNVLTISSWKEIF